ncbi:MAG: LPS assembly lipoprotein LptE [Myxococcaceae bacterium]
MRAAALCIVLALVTGCGYRFTAGPGSLPEGARTLRAPIFSNFTSEPNVEPLFTQAMREQLILRGVEGGSNAQAWIRGEVRGISSDVTLIQTYRLSVTVSLSLLQGDRVLASTVVTEVDEYPRGTDPIITESNRQAALKRLADLMMRQGYERLAAGG